MVVIKHIAPSVEDYLKLRLDAGLSAKSTEAAKRGLPNACFNITLYYELSLIGMAVSYTHLTLPTICSV